MCGSSRSWTCVCRGTETLSAAPPKEGTGRWEEDGFPALAARCPRVWGPDDPCPVQSYFAGWLSPVGGGVCCSRPLVRFPPESLAGEGSGRGFRRCGGVTPSNAQGCPSSTVVSVSIPLVSPRMGGTRSSPRPVPSALSTSERCQGGLWLGRPSSVSHGGAASGTRTGWRALCVWVTGLCSWPQSEAPRPATERELAKCTVRGAASEDVPREATGGGSGVCVSPA